MVTMGGLLLRDDSRIITQSVLAHFLQLANVLGLLNQRSDGDQLMQHGGVRAAQIALHKQLHIMFQLNARNKTKQNTRTIKLLTAWNLTKRRLVAVCGS